MFAQRRGGMLLHSVLWDRIRFYTETCLYICEILKLMAALWGVSCLPYWNEISQQSLGDFEAPRAIEMKSK